MTDLDATTGDQGHSPFEVGMQAAHGVIKGGALRAEEVIEKVNFRVVGLANVAVLGLVEMPLGGRSGESFGRLGIALVFDKLGIG